MPHIDQQHKADESKRLSSLVWMLGLCLFGYLTSLPAWAQTAYVQNKPTTPIPWSGPRDKSCDVYHSNKYKKPLYDANAINEQLISVLGVDNTPKLFYRWERPVRYYLEVPAEYPQLAKQFEAQVAQVARYTGLDIKRHDKPYIERKDEKLNDRSKWPEGLSTNSVVIWTADMDNTLDTPLVKKLNEGFGVSVEQARKDWEKSQLKSKKMHYNGFESYGHDEQGISFSFLLYEPTIRVFTNAKSLERPYARSAFALITISLRNGAIPSILSDSIASITDFDKQFLRVLYGPHVHSGMLLIKAKRLMMEELIDCFNAKGA